MPPEPGVSTSGHSVRISGLVELVTERTDPDAAAAAVVRARSTDDALGLAVTLFRLWRATGDLTAFDEAAAVLGRLEAGPSATAPLARAILAIAWRSRAHDDPTREILDAALAAARAGVPAFLPELRALRYAGTSSPTDLDQAITDSRALLAREPDDLLVLVRLAALLGDRAAAFPTPEHRAEALETAATAMFRRDVMTADADDPRHLFIGAVLRHAMEGLPDTPEAGAASSAALLSAVHAAAEPPQAAARLLGVVAALFEHSGRVADLRVVLSLYEEWATMAEPGFVSLDIAAKWMAHAERLTATDSLTGSDLFGIIRVLADAPYDLPPYSSQQHVDSLARPLGEAISLWDHLHADPLASDLDAIIKRVEPLLPRFSPGTRASLLSLLGSLSVKRYNRAPSEENSASTVAFYRELVEFLPDDSDIISILAEALVIHHHATGERRHRDEAVALLRGLTAGTSGRVTSQTSLSMLAFGLEPGESLEDLLECVRLMAGIDPLTLSNGKVVLGYVSFAEVVVRHALACSPPLPDAALADLSRSCALILRVVTEPDRFDHMVAMVAALDMSLAKQHGTDALTALAAIAGTDAGGWSRAILDSALAELADTTAMNDAEECARVERRLTTVLTGAAPGVSALRWLALELSHRFQGAMTAPDLWTAVAAARALVARGGSDPWSARTLTDLLLSRHQRYGGLADLDDAVRLIEETLALVGPGTLRSRLSENLAGILAAQYAVLGDLALLDRSIEAMREVFELEADDSAGLPIMLTNLGSKLLDRYVASGTAADLHEAVRSADTASATLTHESDDRVHFQVHNLTAGAYRYLFELSDEPVHIDRALTAMRAALSLVGPGHPMRPAALSNLAETLRQKENSTPDSVSLDEIIALHREALDLSSATEPARPGRLASLAVALGEGALNDPARAGDSAEAVALLRESAAALPATAAYRNRSVLILAGLLGRDTASPEDAAESVALARALTTAPGTAVDLRLRAGLLWARTAERHCSVDDALDAWDEATGVLAGLADQKLTRTDQERFLSFYQGGVARGAAFAVRSGRPDRALDLVERGRAVLWPRPADADVSWRDLPGLLGDDLAVTLVADSAGAVALVVGADGITQTVLPGLTDQVLSNTAAVFLAVLSGQSAGNLDAYITAQEVTGELLHVLWHSLAAPILDGLPDGPDGRRIVWCPTGATALLPLHAATDAVSGRSLLDVAVSSYTPSLRALASVRRRPAADGVVDRMLIVAVEEHPETAALEHVRGEVDGVRELLPDAVHTVLPNLKATRDAVRRELAGHRFAHFACHAVTNPLEPGRNGLVLAGGVLTALEIGASLAADPELAYLSACGTAAGGVRLVDEAVTPAHALFMNGFRQVIGTLWPIADEQAAAVAREFYRRLATGTDAAEAIGRATSAIRREHPFEPLLWASHVHIGG
ncbi:CHAT domain-containing protein [Streptomyces sp. MB09-01]|uniref:CHAT domain-containing protein n=1 Tax=Streptomyces sp. MB09-01 TaxID=3028666 RepID=UPI0029AACF32|nr:CHAT domain-containing protein [Streptomyces sp. MB09-01]MDX3538949.1 CHAT domain-containing protein [Streptomyces sp. MB09-01]